VTLLIDAMGTSVMAKHLSKEGFFYTHLNKEMTTVFPPTTSAATTAFRTGKSPAENGWLGWDQYFKEVDDNVILFLGKSQYTDVQYPDLIAKALPMGKDLVEELREHHIQSDSVWPGWGKEHPSDTYQELLNNALKTAQNKQNRFTYVYWDALDTLMHQKGPSSKETEILLKEIEEETERFAKQLPADCALMIVADHSQIDVHQQNLDEDRELCSCFRHEPALEPRVIAFYIQPEKREKFLSLFRKNYGKDYDLYTHEEVLHGRLFGTGAPHARMEEFIGDYVAIAKTHLQLSYRRKKTEKGDHAGGTREEAMIPLILYAKK
jgi:predicted AlkP superfamily pyrophosphatase or phosphodiesterase